MKKVSVLSPCYNGAEYLSRLFKSILEQNYSPLEVVIVNDGSTDATEDVILEYKKVFEEQGVEFKYISKPNGGQASAIALGIKQVTGDYLIWPDSDDFLLPESIAKRVGYMETHPECGIVRSNGCVYDESDCTKAIRAISKFSRTATLEDFMTFSVPWCPGCYMIRMEFFDKVNPERYIADYPIGQDIQMLVPIAYYYPCEYLDEYLFGYVIRANSHSHAKQDYEKQIAKLNNYEACVEETLSIINEDTTQYLELHKRFIRKMRLDTAWKNGKKDDINEYAKALKENGEYGIEEKIKMHFKPSKAVSFALRGIGFFKRKFLKANGVKNI